MSEDKEEIGQSGDLYHHDILNKPDALASVQNELADSRLLALHQFYNMPAVIKRRVRALKKLQFESVKIDVEFYKKLFELEVEYDAKHQAVFSERTKITSGEKEPNDEECEWEMDEKELEKITETLKEASISDDQLEESKDVEVKGIPEFWFTVFKNTMILSDMIQPHDEPILKCLNDVRCQLVEGEEPGFVIEFYFKDNEYFFDKRLTKQYFFRYSPSQDTPLEYDGPEIVRAKGCPINWKPNKNVTVRTVKKHQKHKGRTDRRTITKTVKEDSFFNFFDPPLYDWSMAMEEETEDLLEADFKIGQSMRETLIPRAVLYFTGEALAEEYDEDECEDEFDESDGMDSADDSDSQAGQKPKGNLAGATNDGDQKPECQQQ